MAFKAADNDASRATEIVKATIAANATIASANKTADSQTSAAIGGLVGKILGSEAVISKIIGWF